MNISWNLNTYINIAIVLLYLALIIVGYHKGFLYGIVSLIYTLLSIAVAWFLAPILANKYPIIQIENLDAKYQLLSDSLNLNIILNIIIYFLIVFLVLKLLYLIISIALKGINKIPVLGGFNKILGAIFGFINATFICVIISMLLTLPTFENGLSIKNNTLLKYTNIIADKGLNIIVENINIDKIKDEFESFDIESARKEFSDWLETRN